MTMELLNSKIAEYQDAISLLKQKIFIYEKKIEIHVEKKISPGLTAPLNYKEDNFIEIWQKTLSMKTISQSLK